MSLRWKRVYPDAKPLLPPATPGSAGYDLYSYCEDATIEPNDMWTFNTGIAVAIPKGHYGRVAPRSSMSLRGLIVSAGVLDSDYRGEIKVIVTCVQPMTIKKGEKIAQLILEKCSVLPTEEVEELDSTERGEKGFGSTGH